MRIFNSDKKCALNNVILYLEIDEAKEMFYNLQSLIESYGKKGQHAHINDRSFDHEITLTIYNKDDLSGLDKASIELINNEES